LAESTVNPEQESQKRRSTRIVQAVPLTVTGVDALGRPFQERTSTLIINCHGARYQSKHYVLKNMWVTLEVPHNEAGHEARTVRGRVTWIQRPRTVRELFQIGVELEVGGNVWGIAFPPADWFPFPEGGSEPSLEATDEFPKPAQPRHDDEDWSREEMNSTPPPVHSQETFRAMPAPVEPAEDKVRVIPSVPTGPVEDNVRVLPLPAGDDQSLQVARQVARLVAEAKQQIQIIARESATTAVAAETRPMLAALQMQLQDAAQKSVSAAAATQLEKLQQEAVQRMEKEREAATAGILTRLSSELGERLNQARLQIDSQMSEVERTRRADFGQQIQSQLQAAILKMEDLSGTMSKNRDEVRALMNDLRESSAQAAAEEIRRWKEQVDLRTADAQMRLAQMDQSAKKLTEQIAVATTIGEIGWRGLLEADLAAASTRWQEKMDSSIEETSRLAAEQIARNSEASARQIEQQIQDRINTLGNAHSQVTAEAESALTSLQAAIGKESARGEELISKFQQSFTQLEARRSEFSSQLQSASDEWTRRGQAMLEAQSHEMNSRAELAVSGMAQRLQPMLETAGRDSIEKLAGEFEQRFAPQIARATELLSKLAIDQEQAEKTAAEHQQRIWQASERGLQDTAARGKELLAQIEKDFADSARTSTGRWVAELEARATETSHSTFETLYKSADWYEKKISTQMQTTLEKGLDQAALRLREKAAEMSGLFASELDHYSRSYVEHAHGQMQQNALDAAEQGTQQIVEAGDAAAAKFTERAAQLSQDQFEIHASRAKAAMEQNAAIMDAHTTHIRANLESDARGFASEFQRVLSQHAQQTLALGKQELGLQIDQAKDSLLIETQTLERHFQSSLNSLGTLAMDEHKQRLENASNTWLLTTVSKLNQKSETFVTEMSETTEKKLKAICANVLSEMGDVLRQRLAGLAAPFAAPTSPASPASTGNLPEEEK
jgi:hypothetical protein